MKSLMGGGYSVLFQNIKLHLATHCKRSVSMWIILQNGSRQTGRQIVSLWMGFAIGVSRLVYRVYGKEGIIQAKKVHCVNNLFGH